MSELISGKEALIALANGEDVEGNIGYGWHPIPLNKDVLLNSFLHEKNRDGDDIKFRLKPRTITLNGIEVPAPFEPKVGDAVYFIDCETSDGYSCDVIGFSFDISWIQFGAWRTESEIKQVVAALNQVFKGAAQ